MSDRRDDFMSQPRYGTANPERVENELWDLAISENWSGYALRQHLGVGDTDEHRRHTANTVHLARGHARTALELAALRAHQHGA